MRKWLLGAAVGVGLLAVPLTLLAQTVIQDDITGNECWNAGQGPGGPGSYLCSNTVRNSIAKVQGALTGALTFGTGSLASLRFGGLALITTQPLASTTFTLPPNPVPDGAKAGFCNVTGSAFATTTIAMTTSTGQTLNTTVSLNNLGAVTCKEVVFNRANTTWYVIR
jgi:hypothetical protein